MGAANCVLLALRTLARQSLARLWPDSGPTLARLWRPTQASLWSDPWPAALGVASRPAPWSAAPLAPDRKSVLLRRRQRGTDRALARDERSQCQGIARSLGLLDQLQNAGQRLFQACHGFAPQVLDDHAGEKPSAWLIRGKCGP